MGETSSSRSFCAAGLAVALLVLLVGPALTPVGLAEGAVEKLKEKKKSIPMSEEVEDTLPNWEDDTELKRDIKCNGASSPKNQHTHGRAAE